MATIGLKKWTSFALTAVLGASVLAGCGTSTNNSQTTPAPKDNAGSGSAPSSQVTSLTGAGSTFDYPFFSKAFYTYGQQNNLKVNYQSIGSGGGIQQFTKQTVDFGATDVPMNDKELAEAAKTGGDVVQIPVTLGATAISYNIPEVKDQLKFTPDVLAGIYLGKIKTWNDAAIVKENPTAKLPNKPITVVHRSDGSGTTYIFTDYLSAISSDWKTQVGKGKDVKWPVGLGAKGNEAVAGQVLKTPYSIGYVELAYVIQTKMSYALVQNKDGKFVAPSLQSATAAAAQFPNVSYKDFSIVNAAGADSYPISGYSWVTLYKDQKDEAKGKTLVNLFNWLVTTGQADAESVHYAKLPENVQKAAVTSLKTIQSNGKALLQ